MALYWGFLPAFLTFLRRSILPAIVASRELCAILTVCRSTCRLQSSRDSSFVEILLVGSSGTFGMGMDYAVILLTRIVLVFVGACLYPLWG